MKLLEFALAIVATCCGIAMLLYGLVGLPITPATIGYRIPTDELSTDNSIHILMAGTSLTSRGEWDAELAGSINDCSTFPVTVERLAKAGQGIRWGAPAIAERLSDEHLPKVDIVIAEFAVNDAALNHGLPLIMAKSMTRQMVEDIRNADAVPFLSTMNPVWGLKAMSRLGQYRYYATYRDLAEEMQAGLIDTIPVWQSIPASKRREYIPDLGHPTDEAKVRFQIPLTAEAICKYLAD